MAAVAVKYPAFQELGAEILTVSTDSADTHRDWHERELSRMVPGGARYPMLSDPGGKIGKQLEFMILINRLTCAAGFSSILRGSFNPSRFWEFLWEGMFRNSCGSCGPSSTIRKPGRSSPAGGSPESPHYRKKNRRKRLPVKSGKSGSRETHFNPWKSPAVRKPGRF